MTHMNIGIDLDNVLADFQTTYLAFHNKYYGTTLTPKDITTFEYPPFMQITPEESEKRVYEFFESDEFDDIKPWKGSKDAIGKLSKKYSLYIVTSRPDSTNGWVDRYFPDQMDDILHSNQFLLDHDGKVTKATICKEKEISVMIEDAENYAEEVSAVGIKALLLDQPYNQDFKEKKNITKVYSWEEIVREIGTMK